MTTVESTIRTPSSGRWTPTLWLLFGSLLVTALWFRPAENKSRGSGTIPAAGGAEIAHMTVVHNSFASQAPLDILFIHHSCGGQLLADYGPDLGTNCIYQTHPNGGGLRTRLEKRGYAVHEASYGSKLGDRTDLFDWLPKFRNQMDHILACDCQDGRQPDGRKNRIVVFKSCYPNNSFSGEGKPPGNPSGPELTLWNAKATYRELLKEFQARPGVLFVCMTAPPLAPKAKPEAAWKRVARSMLQGASATSKRQQSARLAREFNDWLASEDGWLKESGVTNVAVFNYFAILTDSNQSGLSVYPTNDGFDSHPSRQGNEKAAEAFVLFLENAAVRAGLTLAPAPTAALE